MDRRNTNAGFNLFPHLFTQTLSISHQHSPPSKLLTELRRSGSVRGTYSHEVLLDVTEGRWP